MNAVAAERREVVQPPGVTAFTVAVEVQFIKRSGSDMPPYPVSIWACRMLPSTALRTWSRLGEVMSYLV